MRLTTFHLLLCLVACVNISSLVAQSLVPLGTWRAHHSFNRIHSVTLAPGQVFAAGQNAVLVYDTESASMEVIDKTNRLSNAGISIIEYAQQGEQLIVAYEDGTFDVLTETDTRNFDPARNAIITGSRKINSITIRNGLAYFSTDYGVLVFDLSRSEIKETWRDLGRNGSTTRILGATFLGDEIFLATEKGVMWGNVNDNLLDFTKWERLDTGDFSSAVKVVATFYGDVYAGIDTKGLYRFTGDAWVIENFLEGISFTSMGVSEEFLMVSEANQVWLLDEANVLTKLTTPFSSSTLDIVQDENSSFWLADGKHGLITNFSGAFVSILPAGPASDSIHQLKQYGNIIYAVHGGYNQSNPLRRAGDLSVFEDGTWSVEPTEVKDITSIAVDQAGTRYLSSFGDGVLKVEKSGATTLYDASNSPLVNTNPPGNFVTITDLAPTTDGLWISNYGAMTSLHFLSPSGAWDVVNLAGTPGMYPVKLEADLFGNVWMVIDPARGGGVLVFHESENQWLYLTSNDGNGELPSNTVYDLETDRDGYVWVGTDEGVAYFYSKTDDAVKPLFENRFLLRDDNVKCIAVDGGNRKWMGTDRGLWLFNASGEKLVAHFTTENSPLPSDKIIDIEINHATGEVFIATDFGLISYRADATEGIADFQTVKIFPNPVADNFNGLVGISGLASDAIVKITDVSGRLIWQAQANGGSAAWNVQDYRGRRVNTGIFLVYAISADGTESIVGKIAVIN